MTGAAPTVGAGSPATAPTAGTGAAGSSAGAGATSAAAGSGGSGPKGLVVPVAQCTDPHDQMLYNMQATAIRNISSNCASGKLMGPSGENCVAYAGNPTDPKAIACFQGCVKPEMMKEFNDVLSDQCLACPNAVVQCAAKYCLAQCLANPMDPKCTACLCQARADLPDPGVMGSCLFDVFQKCAGFMTTMDTVGCGAVAGSGAAGAAGGGAGGMSGSAGGGAGASGGSAGHAGGAAGGGAAGHAAGSGASSAAGHGGAGGR
jgi:hypothetical protein